MFFSKVLQENAQKYPGGILVVTDGAFSMDGDIANLPAIIDVVHKHNAMLLIDDAHATCVIGEKGAGTLHEWSEEIPIIFLYLMCLRYALVLS